MHIYDFNKLVTKSCFVDKPRKNSPIFLDQQVYVCHNKDWPSGIVGGTLTVEVSRLCSVREFIHNMDSKQRITLNNDFLVETFYLATFGSCVSVIGKVSKLPKKIPKRKKKSDADIVREIWNNLPPAPRSISKKVHTKKYKDSSSMSFYDNNKLSSLPMSTYMNVPFTGAYHNDGLGLEFSFSKAVDEIPVQYEPTVYQNRCMDDIEYCIIHNKAYAVEFIRLYSTHTNKFIADLYDMEVKKVQVLADLIIDRYKIR